MKSTIALFGPIASGKGVMAEILIQKGYAHFSYRDKLQEELKRRGLPLDRTAFQQTANSLRQEFGNDMQARSIGTLIKQFRLQGNAEKAVIDSLRHPDDARWLKENLGAYIIGITAPSEMRFQRLLGRARLSDPITLEDFNRADQRDRGIGQPEYGDQIDACLRLADCTIDNIGTREELESKLNEAIITLGIEGTPLTKEKR